MDVVFDINVLVSALIARGKPRQLWMRAVRGEFKLVLSKAIVEDFIQVMGRTKIRRYVEERDIMEFLEALSTSAEFVRTKSRFRVVKEDPDDDIILITAYDAKVDYIVSGDRHLLDLKEFRGIEIVTVGRMLQMMQGEG